MNRLPNLLESGAPSGDLSLTCNLLLTRRCNFSCEFCMFAAGPKLPGLYMSNTVLSQITRAMEDIRQELILAGRMPEYSTVAYNMVGGEPTLDTQEFGRCVEYLVRNEHSLEMTTNGWWLRNAESLTGFLRAVQPWYSAGEGSIRISDSPYHRQFRTPMEAHNLECLSKGEGHDAVQEVVDSLLSDGESLNGVDCPECGAWVAYGDFDTHVLDDCNCTPANLESAMDAAHDRQRETIVPYWLQGQLAEMLEPGAGLRLYVDHQKQMQIT